MLFNTILEVSKKYPTNLAINEINYQDLIELIKSRPYSLVCTNTGADVILDILTASYHNKPIFVLPKYHREEITVPTEINIEKFQLILYSSGSTGTRKQIIIPENMILKNANNSVICQELTSKDKILTVCSLNHTGGLNAQTMGGLTVGAHVIVKEFNPFNFFKILDNENITVTHLIPIMIDSLIKVNNRKLPPNLRIVMAGSDCVGKHHIKFWNDLNVAFILNYGLTEAGPVIINHKFIDNQELEVFDIGVPIGSTVWCDYKIIDNELYLKGDEINTKEWLLTGDCVELINEWFFYRGRKSSGCKIIPKKY